MKDFYADAGDSIKDALVKLLEASERTQEAHSMDFNDVLIVARPGTTMEGLWSQWIQGTTA